MIKAEKLLRNLVKLMLSFRESKSLNKIKETQAQFRIKMQSFIQKKLYSSYINKVEVKNR